MQTNSKITHVVLTGGVGSRLWPLSRKSKPKQYLEIFDTKSLLELNIERNMPLTDKVVVVGNVENLDLSIKVLAKFDIPHEHIIEATPRNTAAAIAFAAFNSYKDDILIVTPSDHIIEVSKLYDSAIRRAIDMAKNNYLVTFGIVPTKPETGYGYIEFEQEDVIAFHEKPTQGKAEEFIERGNFYWNSGLFCFKAGLYLEELKKQEPTVYATALQVWNNNVSGLLDHDLSLLIPAISVDYAVMERSQNIKVVPSHFDWSDLGSFESVYEYLVSVGHAVDANGNIEIGVDKHVSFVGLQNCIVVNTPDALLIVQKENSQDVKQLYQYLESIDSPLL